MALCDTHSHVSCPKHTRWNHEVNSESLCNKLIAHCEITCISSRRRVFFFSFLDCQFLTGLGDVKLQIIKIVADLSKEINLWIRDSPKKSSFTYWVTINLKDSTVLYHHVFWKLIFPWFINTLSFESCLLCTGLLHRLFSFVKNTLTNDKYMYNIINLFHYDSTW